MEGKWDAALGKVSLPEGVNVQQLRQIMPGS